MHELYHLLEPDERVVYQARGAWVPRTVLLVMAFSMLLIAHSILLFGAFVFLLLDALEEAGAFSPGVEWAELVRNPMLAAAGCAVYAALLFACVWRIQRFSRTGALLTDRRLLGRSFERDAEIEVISLDEIATIERHPSSPAGRLVVTTRTGQSLSLGPLHLAGRFATTLAAMTGLHAPKGRHGGRGMESLLQPGEQIRYRGPRLWWPRVPLPETVFLASLLGMCWLMLGGPSRDASDVVVPPTVMLLVGLAICQVGLVWKLRATAVVVTDRRVIYRSGRPGPEFKDIALAGIEAVHCETAGPGGSAIVTDRHDHDFYLRNLGDPRGLLEHIAETTGARRPSFDSLLAWRVVLALGPTALLLMAILQYLIEWAIGASVLPLEEGSKNAELALGALPLLLGFVASIYLGPLVAIASLRPFVTVEEIRAAIRVVKRGPEQSGLSSEWAGILRHWAGLLYGRRFATADEGAKSHG
jgi:hypothetical protein